MSGEGKLSKKHINNKGYNKYLKLVEEINITIDYGKYENNAKWDGFKRYLTNTALHKEEVISQYRQLWNIEKHLEYQKPIY